MARPHRLCNIHKPYISLPSGLNMKPRAYPSLWDRIIKYTGGVDPFDAGESCLEWQGALATNEGYAQLTFIKRAAQFFNLPKEKLDIPSKTVSIYVNRLLAMIHLNRWLTTGETMCHTCDNPPCVNYNHLYVGDSWRNTQDSIERGRAYLFGHGNGRDNRGEAHYRSVLKEWQVIGIINDLVMGRRVVDIAREGGWEQSMISSINCGRTWKHLPRKLTFKVRR